ncbi:MAG: hypothetical protein ACRD26_22855 [Vicinamibacterales bacterium]
MQRRTLLQMLVAAAAWLRFAPASLAQAPGLSRADEARLRALADVVLPGELGAGRAMVVDGFLRWIRNYREGAEMDHGYGFTRLRRTAPSPASRYPAQLAALERAARARGGSFESLDAAARRQVVEAAVAAAQVERLPVRPTGEHVATDLMAFYFNGSAANDLAYRAAIARDRCRGLPGSDERPASARDRRGVESAHGDAPAHLPGMRR